MKTMAETLKVTLFVAYPAFVIFIMVVSII